MDFNPYLKTEKVDTGSGGGKGFIEAPDDFRFNIIHQTRSASPDEYENALCDALQNLFLQDITDIEGLVKGLNAAEFRSRNGAIWTVESFEATMVAHNEKGI